MHPTHIEIKHLISILIFILIPYFVTNSYTIPEQNIQADNIQYLNETLNLNNGNRDVINPTVASGTEAIKDIYYVTQYIPGPRGEQGLSGRDGKDGTTTVIYVNNTNTQGWIGGSYSLPTPTPSPIPSITNSLTIATSTGLITSLVNGVTATSSLEGLNLLNASFTNLITTNLISTNSTTTNATTTNLSVTNLNTGNTLSFSTSTSILTSNIGGSIGTTSISLASTSLFGFNNTQLTFGDSNGKLSQSSNLVWDNVNGRLGIGIAKPQALLDLNYRYVGTSTAYAQRNISSFSVSSTTGTGLYYGIFNQLNLSGNTWYSQSAANSVTNLYHQSSGSMDTLYGSINQIWLQGTGNINNTIGFGGTITRQNNYNTSRIVGVSGSIRNQAAGAVTNINGGYFTIYNTNTGGGVTNASTLEAYIENASTSAITNAYGLKIFATSTAGGLINNMYGVYISDHTSPLIKNPFGIYQLGTTTKNFFAGSVGIGTSSPNYKLEIVGDINAVGNVRANGIVLNSDERFKTNITKIENGLSIINQLNPVTYSWNELGISKGGSTSTLQYGLLAQEVQNILPYSISTSSDDYLSLNYISIIPYLISSIKEISNKISDVFTVNKIQSKELCLEDVCITKDQLKTLLQNANLNSDNINNTYNTNSTNTNTQIAPTLHQAILDNKSENEVSTTTDTVVTPVE